MKLPRATRLVIRIAGVRMYLWRAVDHEGEVLDMLVQRRRDTRAALRLMRKLLKKQGFVPKVATPGHRAVEERHSHQAQSGCTATPAASRSAAPRHHRFRTDAQIARRLQKARSAPDSARQDRSGRKFVARRPLVGGGGP